MDCTSSIKFPTAFTALPTFFFSPFLFLDIAIVPIAYIVIPAIAPAPIPFQKHCALCVIFINTSVRIPDSAAYVRFAFSGAAQSGLVFSDKSIISKNSKV